VGLDNTAVHKYLKDGFPAVVSPRREMISGFVNILENRTSSGETAARHLLGLGLGHFAYCSYESFYWSDIRRDAFAKYLARKGRNVELYHLPSRARRIAWDRELTAVIDWLRSLPKPVGVMACNDDRGREVLQACHLANLRVPEEVAVIGVDNDELLCEMSFPPLSSVVMNHKQVGFAAAAALDAMMAGRKPPSRTIHLEPLHVIARQSTETVANQDAVVQKARRFIRANLHRPLKTQDVAGEVGLSRYDLHDRFCRAVGRPVGEEIRNIRIEQFRRLLVETDLPVSTIAAKVGSSSPANVARFFRESVGMNPASYRKKYKAKR
jgi:LacI family transcriptional regulator